MARSPENEAIRQCEAKLVTEVEKSLDRIVGEAHPGKLITDDQWDEIMQLPATKRQRAQKFVNCMLGTVKDSATFKKFCEPSFFNHGNFVLSTACYCSLLL